MKKLFATASMGMTMGLCQISSAALLELPALHLGDDKTLRAYWFPAGQTDSANAISTKAPAAILLHGCGGLGQHGGLNARHQAARDWLLARGISVLFPDSLSSRQLTSLCTQKFSERAIKQRDRVLDVEAAAAWLRTQPNVDPGKLILWGWSHGGSTVLAYTLRPSDSSFVQSIAYYPGCSSYAMQAKHVPPTLNTPLTILIGEADDWTPASTCRALASALKSNHQPIDLALYPNAYHDFDNPAGKKKTRLDVPNGTHPGQGVTVAPDPQARIDSLNKIDALLRQRRLFQLEIDPPDFENQRR